MSEWNAANCGPDAGCARRTVAISSRPGLDCRKLLPHLCTNVGQTLSSVNPASGCSMAPLTTGAEPFQTRRPGLKPGAKFIQEFLFRWGQRHDHGSSLETAQARGHSYDERRRKAAGP